MGGEGKRFFDNGFVIPKPLIDICGKPFFYWSTMSVLKYMPDSDITFAVLREHIDKYDIQNSILRYFPDAKFVVLDHVLPGAVLTCIRAVDEIDSNLPVIFNDCDHLFKCKLLYDMTEETAALYDGFLVTFRSDSPKFSYVETDHSGIVIRTVEKQVISENAICGAYYFANKDIFLESANEYLEKCSYSEYYMSGVYNCMAANGLRSGILETDAHLSFGTPEEYFAAQMSPLFGDLI